MPIELEDIALIGLTSLAACYQQAMFARSVGNMRRKHKIHPPATDGHPEFVRALRAQQNGIEFFGVYMGCLWTAGIFFHQVPASVLGLVYIYGRYRYFNDYIEEAKKRVPGFMICTGTLRIFLLLSSLGLGQTVLLQYAGVDAKASLVNFAKGFIGY